MTKQDERIKELENEVGRLWAQVAALRQRMDADFDFLRGAKFYPLSTPIGHDSFNGDSFSTVGTSTKIENTSWASTIPAEAEALALRLVVRDSATAPYSATSLRFGVGPTPDYWYCLLARPIGDDIWIENSGVVPCTDGDIWYQCTASGTDTLEVHLMLWGYWLREG